MLGAVLVTKIFDVIAGGILGPLLIRTAKPSLFVGAWTAITTALGLHDIKTTARNLRQGGKEADTHINHPRKDKRLK